MKTLILLLITATSTYAAKYRVKLLKNSETQSGYYLAEVKHASNSALSSTVKIYPASKDAYYDMKKYSKGSILEIDGTDEASQDMAFDKINALQVYRINNRPVMPRRDPR